MYIYNSSAIRVGEGKGPSVSGEGKGDGGGEGQRGELTNNMSVRTKKSKNKIANSPMMRKKTMVCEFETKASNSAQNKSIKQCPKINSPQGKESEVRGVCLHSNALPGG